MKPSDDMKCKDCAWSRLRPAHVSDGTSWSPSFHVKDAVVRYIERPAKEVDPEGFCPEFEKREVRQ